MGAAVHPVPLSLRVWGTLADGRKRSGEQGGAGRDCLGMQSVCYAVRPARIYLCSARIYISPFTLIGQEMAGIVTYLAGLGSPSAKTHRPGHPTHPRARDPPSPGRTVTLALSPHYLTPLGAPDPILTSVCPGQAGTIWGGHIEAGSV